MTETRTKNFETSNSKEDFHECSEDPQYQVIAFENHYEDVTEEELT